MRPTQYMIAINTRRRDIVSDYWLSIVIGGYKNYSSMVPASDLATLALF